MALGSYPSVERVLLSTSQAIIGPRTPLISVPVGTGEDKFRRTQNRLSGVQLLL